MIWDNQLALDTRRVPRCVRCGARAYWTTAKPAVCLQCTLREEAK